MPGTCDAARLCLVIERSARGVRMSESVALLFPGVGSVTPLGTVTVAVLASEPTAEAATVAVRV